AIWGCFLFFWANKVGGGEIIKIEAPGCDPAGALIMMQAPKLGITLVIPTRSEDNPVRLNKNAVVL
ncbi:MAG: hypothetical protein ACK5BU_04335, partial [Bacteroidota bacterium]